MIWQLMKRDPAWKALPWFALLVLALSLIQSQGRLDSLATQLPVFCGLLAFGIGAGEQQGRMMPFLEPLPVQVRQVYLARVAGMLLLIGTLACIPALVYLVLLPGRASVFVELSLIGMPLVLFLQSLAVCRIRYRLQAGGLLMTAVAMAFATALAESPGWLHAALRALMPVSILISSLIFAWTWRALPRLAEATWKQTGTAPPCAWEARARRYPWWLYNWRDLLWAGVMFMQTSLGIWLNGVLFFWSGSIQTREYIRWMDSLPVNRRFLFGARLAPTLIALALGYIAAMQFGWGSSWNRQLTVTNSQQWRGVDSPMHCRTSNVQPPIDYWRPARNGPAPVIQAPWGEGFQPPVVRVFGVQVYDPYAVGCDNTKRFFDWQYKRASLAVYGRWIPPDQTPAPVPPARSVILNIGAMWTCALASLFPIALADWWRFRRLPVALRTVVLVLIAGAMFGSVFVPEALPGTQWVSWQLPDSLAVVIAVSVAAPVAVYLLMEQLFLRAELTAWGARLGQTPGNYT